MPLPSGIVPDSDTYTLTPTAEAYCLRRKYQRCSPRTLAVGLPEAAHYAWDMENGRLVMCWRGAFMNAEGAWHGRNAAVQEPAGTSILLAPPGHAVEVLSNRTIAWPLPEKREPNACVTTSGVCMASNVTQSDDQCSGSSETVYV